MVLTKALALKLLGGLGLVGTVAGTAIYLGQNQKKKEVDTVDSSLPTAGDSGQKKKEEEEVEDEPRTGTDDQAWMTCTVEGDNDENKKECVLGAGQKMNIMVEDKKVTVEGPLKLGEIKIMQYFITQTSGIGYEKNKKYVIEGGDIPLNKKKIPSLKNMESYEVKEIEGISYFVRKNSSGVEKGNMAGFPEDCILPEEGVGYCREVAEKDLEHIKFKDKNKAPVVNNKSKKIDIKITKVNENKEDFGYRVVFQSPEIIEIDGMDSIIPYTNTEFMFKPNSNASVDVERVWDVKKLGEKVGLVCENNECSLGEAKTLNLFRDGNPLTGVKASGGSLTYEKNKEGYNQGFKFLVKGTVTLENNGTLEDNYSYEIKEHGGNLFLYRRDH